MNGQAYVALPQGVSIHSLETREQISALQANVPSCTEHNPKEAAQLLEMGKAMGRAIYDDAKRSVTSFLKSNVGFIFGGCMSIGAVLVLNMGSDAPVPAGGEPTPSPTPEGDFGGTSSLPYLMPLARGLLAVWGVV